MNQKFFAFLSMVLSFGIAGFAAPASANLACTPMHSATYYNAKGELKTVTVASDQMYTALTLTAMNPYVFSYTVTNIWQKPATTFTSSASQVSTSAATITYKESQEDAAETFWNSYAAPGNVVSFDVQDSIMKTNRGQIFVWGWSFPEDNPVDTDPALIAAFDCK